MTNKGRFAMRRIGWWAIWGLFGVVGAAAGQERKLELVVQTGHTHAINSACYSPDGKWLVTASGDQMAMIWDASNGAQLRTLKGHGPCLVCEFRPGQQACRHGIARQDGGGLGRDHGREAPHTQGSHGECPLREFQPGRQAGRHGVLGR
jgi:hypothetical protein